VATNNRFKKSIESATDNTEESILGIATYSARGNILENAKDNIKYNKLEYTLKNTKSNIISNTSNDILKKILESEKKEKGNNHTLYLSADVGEALNNLAKTSSKSKSALVDEILRAVLINQ